MMHITLGITGTSFVSIKNSLVSMDAIGFLLFCRCIDYANSLKV